MGNKDARGREKKKPKKKEVKFAPAPVRRVTEYRPAPTPPPSSDKP
jgi:hypothetical protein